MLEVGVTGQNGKSEGGLTFLEQRTHFGLWCDPPSPTPDSSYDICNPH